ncbi:MULTISPECIES: hypothetical protein [Streptomyces]|uniref:hypothetical protein n=1 Tax=Streptomyces TaxID=1883 RepID=UPI001E378AA9|nr:hypothetical protein [Streptomyces sp. MNU103]
MTPREHEDGMRHEPTLSAGEKADGFAAVMQRLQSHSPDDRARLQTQAEAAALGHEAYALGQEHLERGDFEASRRWLRVAAGHHIPGAARALEEIALRQALDEFTDGAAVGGAHAPAGVVPCEAIPSPPSAVDGGRPASSWCSAAHVRATTSSIEDALRDVISSAQASGQLPDTRSARDLARYLIVTMQGLKVMGAINPDRASLMAVAETAVDALG